MPAHPGGVPGSKRVESPPSQRGCGSVLEASCKGQLHLSVRNNCSPAPKLSQEYISPPGLLKHLSARESSKCESTYGSHILTLNQIKICLSIWKWPSGDSWGDVCFLLAQANVFSERFPPSVLSHSIGRSNVLAAGVATWQALWALLCVTQGRIWGES